MPTVPTLDAPTVSLRPLPDARVADVQPGNDAIMAGNAAMSVSNAAGNAAIRLQDKRNADQIFQAETSLRDDYLQFENQVKQRTGQNAWGVTNEATKWFDDNVTKRASALENDVQRGVFMQTAAQLRTRSLDVVSQHEAVQHRASVEESAKASILSSINLAAADAHNPAAVSTAKTDILKRMQVTAELNGWTPERRALEESNTLTNLHRQVIRAQIDTNSEAAKAYYDANKGEIAGAEHAEIEKALNQGTLAAKAQTAVDSVMGRDLSRAEALAEVRKSFKGAEEDEVVRRVEARYAELESTRQQDERARADDAWKLYATGGMSAIPPTMLAGLDGRTLMAMKREEKARVSGADIETDWERYEALRTIARASPQQFAAVDLRQEFGRLSPTERRALITLQDQVNKPDTANDVAGFDAQLGNAHDLLKINKSEHAEKRGRFDTAVMQQADAAARQLGRKLNYQERQQIIDRAMIEGKVAGSGILFDDRRRVYELTPNESANFVPGIPEADRQAISAALAARGKQVTEAEVMRVYRKARGL